MKKISVISIAVIIIIIGFVLAVNFNVIPKKEYGEYDKFVICLKSSGAKLYGDYANSDTLKQMSFLGDSYQMLIDTNIYIECNRYGYNPKTDKCKEEGITGYPTWVIKGNKYAGIQGLNKLSSLTGCES